MTYRGVVTHVCRWALDTMCVRVCLSFCVCLIQHTGRDAGLWWMQTGGLVGSIPCTVARNPSTAKVVPCTAALIPCTAVRNPSTAQAVPCPAALLPVLLHFIPCTAALLQFMPILLRLVPCTAAPTCNAAPTCHCLNRWTVLHNSLAQLHVPVNLSGGVSLCCVVVMLWAFRSNDVGGVCRPGNPAVLQHKDRCTQTP